MIRRTSLIAVTLAGLALGIFACSKSKPPEEPSPAAPPSSNQTVAAPASRVVPPVLGRPASTNALPVRVTTNTPSSPNITNMPLSEATNTIRTAGDPASPRAATPQQIQHLATLEKNYFAASSFDDRFDVALAIGKTGTAEAVKTLEKLFRVEKDSELRTELINALIDIGECKEEKMDLLRLGIAAEQAAETREAAIDGLIDLVDPRGLPILKEMTNDPNEQVRAVAKHALALLTELLKTP